MDVLAFLMLAFCIAHCYGQNLQRKLDILQLRVDDLNDLAFALRLDIADLQSWKNATVKGPRETGGIDTDNKCVDVQLLGRFEQSFNDMEGRVKYIIKGMDGEKMALREKVENIRAVVGQKCKTKFNEEKNDMEKAFDAKLKRLVLKTKSKFKKEKIKMEKAFDAKLNQQILKIMSKVAQINEQFNPMSKQLETSRNNNDKAAGQLEVVSNPVDTVRTTIKDNTGIMKHRDEQYYINMEQDGWLRYNNYLYKVFKQYVTFDTAVKNCEDQNASLVEITDQEESQFLSDNTKANFIFWVGATDRETEGEWRWLSGPLVRDGSWGSGQPDNASDGQNCMLMSSFSSKYYDGYCTATNYYVCKRQ